MRYLVPTDVDEAIAALKGSKNQATHILAGGTDLLVRMKTGFVAPDTVVDIKRIEELRVITKEGKGFNIGATVTCAELGEHAALRKAWPGVVEAANLIGSDQVQNRCTIAGNLCNASPAADSVPALIAADATAWIVNSRGYKGVSIDKIPTGPGTNSLKAGEFLHSISLPARPAKSGDAYLRFIPRTEMDIAVVSAAVNLTLGARGVITDARVALGAVAPTALLVKKAAKALIGTKADDEALAKMAQACADACNPIDDKRGTAEYRIKVAKVLATRAARIAYTRAGGK